MQKKTLDESNLKFSKLSVLDDVGRVFYFEEKVYRGIYPTKVEYIMEMFKNGFLKELMEKQMIPKTKISNYHSENFPVILEHEKIEVHSYIYEWTFNMIKDAALLVIHLSKIALKYGYRLKDCHAYNILFKETAPIYVDIGSFVKNDKDTIFPINEFEHWYTFPLKMLQTNYPTIRELLFTMGNKEIVRYKYAFSPVKLKIFSFIKKRKTRFICEINKVKFIYKFISKYLIMKYYKEIQDINLNKRTKWGSYHHDILNNDGEIIPVGLRFHRIVDIIEKLGISTVIEIAGNSGAFSLLLSKTKSIKRIICTDYDENAIDNLYRLIKMNKNKKPDFCKVYPLYFDVSERFQYINCDDFAKRMKSDCVIVLALTHHLLLSQYINIERMFETFSMYTSKYIVIEFMPLGLWEGKKEIPEVPYWYKIDWFKRNMELYFQLLMEERLERNRILLVGIKNN